MKRVQHTFLQEKTARPARRPAAGLTLGAALMVGVVLPAAPAAMLCQSTHSSPSGVEESTYFEFGTVAELGDHAVAIQTLDGPKAKIARQSFELTPETRADLVHVGDPVEVIYSDAGGALTLRRLVALSPGIPKVGPPPPHRHDPAVSPPLAAAASSHNSQKARNASAAPSKVTATAPSPRSAHGETPVNLGVRNAPRPAEILAAPLGSNAAAKPLVPVAIQHAIPAEECHRSSPEWPSQPLSIAVIDFRYPTEKEESHDLARTGGGSGTAVADLVFARLSAIQTGFAIDRGDRRRLDRTDFAGAARLGRQLGVDAVLAGTFAPVEDPAPSEYGSAVKAYQLHAGLVDTCTGQLLMKLSSDLCAIGGACAATVSAKEAENPAAYRPAFAAPIDSLLYPLEHNQTPSESGGVVKEAEDNTATLELPPGVSLRPGDLVAIHASRLTKNPSTYTLQALHDEEIGRVSIQSLHGSTATGTFTGDIPPRPGDTVKLLSDNSASATN